MPAAGWRQDIFRFLGVAASSGGNYNHRKGPTPPYNGLVQRGSWRLETGHPNVSHLLHAGSGPKQDLEWLPHA